MTVGSKSMNTARGTCFPVPVSEKNVLNESTDCPIDLSDGIWPSGWIPCSKQYSSQHELPIWIPAWPTCKEIHSRYIDINKNKKIHKSVHYYFNQSISYYHLVDCIRGLYKSFHGATERWGPLCESVISWAGNHCSHIFDCKIRSDTSTFISLAHLWNTWQILIIDYIYKCTTVGLATRRR